MRSCWARGEWERGTHPEVEGFAIAEHEEQGQQHEDELESNDEEICRPHGHLFDDDIGAGIHGAQENTP